MTQGPDGPHGTEPEAEPEPFPGPTPEPVDDPTPSAEPIGPPDPDDAGPGERPYSLWSPIAADTSDAPRPDPDDVNLLQPTILLFAPVLIVALGVLVARELVWDNFIDVYIWNPIVVDSGFNPVNTLAWVILLGLLLFFAVRLTQKIEQPVDFALVLAVVPYIMGGSIARVLEDTGYFAEPLRFFFITPIIYVAIFAVAIAWLAIGHVLARQARSVGNENALYALAGFFGVLWVAYTGWSIFGDQLSHFGNPIVLLVCLAVPFAYLWTTTKQSGRLSQVGVMATFGMAFFLFMIYMAVLWHTGTQWDPLVPKPLPADPQPNLWVYPVMLIAPGLVTALVYYIARSGMKRYENLAVFLLPMNLLVVFAQAKDAILTAIGIDFLNYEEKHVLPGFLIDLAEKSELAILSTYPATIVMITAKLAVALLVVYLIDVYAKSDLRKTPNLVGLAKLAIIMVGLAPGTRNGIRIAMGV